MSLEIELSEGHAHANLVRGAEIVLALNAAGAPGTTRLVASEMGSTWRHLLADSCRTRLRELAALPKLRGGAHRLWIGPSAAAPRTLAPGTWCLATDVRQDLRRKALRQMTLAMHLVHPYAADIAYLGGTRLASLPLAVGNSMRATSAQAPSGICVVGSGDAAADRNLVALVGRRTAGDVVFFDPYQHHLATGLPHVRRLVAPVGPARRAMLYASCRFVVSAAPTLGADDHFVCEAMAMGLVPLSAFAPQDMATTQMWDAPSMGFAFSAAVAQTSCGVPPSSPVATPLAQARQIRDVMGQTAQGRPWGTGGRMGTVQSLHSDDVAAVRHADNRACVVVCGVGGAPQSALDAWLSRCDYRALCAVGPSAAVVVAQLTLSLAARHAAAPQTPTLSVDTATGRAQALAWCASQLSASPKRQFDVVHLGDTAANVMQTRALVVHLEQHVTAPEPAVQRGSPATPTLTLLVCDAGAPRPPWVAFFCQHCPQTLVLKLGATDRTEADRTARRCFASLVALPAVDLVIDAAGGAAWLDAACRSVGRSAPFVWPHRPTAPGWPMGLEAAPCMPLHKGACRAAMGWPAEACIVLVSASRTTPASPATMQPIWVVLAALRQRQHQHTVHVVVVMPSASPSDVHRLETTLDSHELGCDVTLCTHAGSPFGQPRGEADSAFARLCFGATDIYLDGPWAQPGAVATRAAAMAAALPIVAWPRAASVDETEVADAQGAGFAIEPASTEAMTQALQAYLMALTLDTPLRARFGARAQAAAGAAAERRICTEALAQHMAQRHAPRPHTRQPVPTMPAVQRLKDAAGITRQAPL